MPAGTIALVVSGAIMWGVLRDRAGIPYLSTSSQTLPYRELVMLLGPETVSGEGIYHLVATVRGTGFIREEFLERV